MIVRSLKVLFAAGILANIAFAVAPVTAEATSGASMIKACRVTGSCDGGAMLIECVTFVEQECTVVGDCNPCEADT